ALVALSGCVELAGSAAPAPPSLEQRGPKQEQELAAPQPPSVPNPRPAGPTPQTRPAPAPQVAAVRAALPKDAVFRISDLPAEWDGVETAGGLWVALPYLPAYRRVLLTDPATGRAVVAKLFWRDPAPGADEAVLSSAAAAALGVSAGRSRLEAVVLDD
ncbi:MAG: hypothetical protein WD969_16295, partial [Paracoccaceae bacterium]